MTSRIRSWLAQIVISLAVSVICLSSMGYAALPPQVAVQKLVTDGISTPVRIALDLSGDMFVTDPVKGGILHLNKYGRLVEKIPTAYNPTGIALTADGNLLVSCETFVSLMNRAGVELRKLGTGNGQFAAARGIAVDATGYIYVADAKQNNVKVFTPAGDFAYSFGASGALAGQFFQPSGVAFEKATKLIAVADSMNGRVQFFDITGKFVKSVGRLGSGPLAFTQPQGISFEYGVDPVTGKSVAKRMYVVDCFQSTVQVLDPAGTGTYLSFIGQYGNANGDLSTPLDIAFDDVYRRILVTNGLGNVTVYGIDGGQSPTNTPPTVPAPISPLGGSEVSDQFPTLVAANATDADGSPLTYDFEILDWTGSLVTTYSGIPAGTGTTSLTLDRLLKENADYNWRVRAYDGIDYSAWSSLSTFYYNAINEPPSAPKLLLPADAATVDSTAVLSWGVAVDPDRNDLVSYTLEVATDPGFASIVATEAGLKGTSLALTALADYSKLQDGAKYFWRVKAVDNHGLPSGSDSVFSFVFDTTVVNITANVPHTKVYLGATYSYPGRYLGEAPLTVKDLPAGTYALEFERSGLEPYYAQLNLAASGSNAAVYGKLKGAKELVYKGGNLLLAPNGLPINGGSSASPLLVDFNGAGGKDLLVADAGGAVTLYRQEMVNGLVAYRNDPLFALNVGSAPVITAADFDNDGKKDLLVGNADGSVALYRNAGTESAPVFSDRTPIALLPPDDGSVVTFAAPAVVDLDGDGKKDLLIGAANGALYFYKNTGMDAAPAFAAAPAVIPAVAGNATPFVCDWEADGVKNVVVGSAAGDLKLFTVNQANPAFLDPVGPVLLNSNNASKAVPLNGGNLAKPFMAAIDPKADKDLLIGNELGELRMYSSVGNKRVAAFTQALLEKVAELSDFAVQNNARSALLTLLGNIEAAVKTGSYGKALTVALKGKLLTTAWFGSADLNAAFAAKAAELMELLVGL